MFNMIDHKLQALDDQRLKLELERKCQRERLKAKYRCKDLLHHASFDTANETCEIDLEIESALARLQQLRTALELVQKEIDSLDWAKGAVLNDIEARSQDEPAPVPIPLTPAHELAKLIQENPELPVITWTFDSLEAEHINDKGPVMGKIRSVKMCYFAQDPRAFWKMPYSNPYKPRLSYDLAASRQRFIQAVAKGNVERRDTFLTEDAVLCESERLNNLDWRKVIFAYIENGGGPK